jgi:hypothetical protein
MGTLAELSSGIKDFPARMSEGEALAYRLLFKRQEGVESARMLHLPPPAPFMVMAKFL